MKKLIIISGIILLSLTGYGQQDSIKVYSTLTVFNQGSISKGQKVLVQDGKFVVDKAGKKKIFESSAMGLNYFIKQGWIYETWQVTVYKEYYLIYRYEYKTIH